MIAVLAGGPRRASSSELLYVAWLTKRPLYIDDVCEHWRAVKVYYAKTHGTMVVTTSG
jgi:hypothetical protein